MVEVAYQQPRHILDNRIVDWSLRGSVGTKDLDHQGIERLPRDCAPGDYAQPDRGAVAQEIGEECSLRRLAGPIRQRNPSRQVLESARAGGRTVQERRLKIGGGIHLGIRRLHLVALPGERPIGLALQAGAARGIEHRSGAALYKIKRRTVLSVNRCGRKAESQKPEIPPHCYLSETTLAGF